MGDLIIALIIAALALWVIETIHYFFTNDDDM